MGDLSVAGKKVFVAGHRGMVGGALARRLRQENCELLLAGRDVVDLQDQAATFAWMARAQPDVVIIAAAKVGGMPGNTSNPADFPHPNPPTPATSHDGAHRHAVHPLPCPGS